jgi:hypothetical protein
MVTIARFIHAISDGDRPGQLVRLGDIEAVILKFESPEALARWVMEHLGEDRPGGPVDVGWILREAAGAVERSSREEECQGNAD